MSNLARPTSSAQSGRSKIVVVRPTPRSVRPEDVGAPRSSRLAVAAFCAAAAPAALWVIGHLGFRLGFAPIVRVPELTGEPGAGLVTGAMILVGVPQMILRAGINAPLLLMLGFALVALPAGALAAARPATPGGPRPKPLIALLANSGATLAMLAAAGLVAWSTLPARRDLVRPLPFEATELGAWLADLRTAAGLDIVALAAAVLWLVLAIRLPIALWLRALATSAASFAVLVSIVSAAITAGAAAHVAVARPVVPADPAAPPEAPVAERLLLGSTPHHLVTLRKDGDQLRVELLQPGRDLVVIRRAAIREME